VTEGNEDEAEIYEQVKDPAEKMVRDIQDAWRLCRASFASNGVKGTQLSIEHGDLPQLTVQRISPGSHEVDRLIAKTDMAYSKSGIASETKSDQYERVQK